MKLIHFDSNTINNRIKNAIQERLRCKAKSLPEDVHIHIGPKPPLSGPGATIRKAALERPLYNYIFRLQLNIFIGPSQSRNFFKEYGHVLCGSSEYIWLE